MLSQNYLWHRTFSQSAIDGGAVVQEAIMAKSRSLEPALGIAMVVPPELFGLPLARHWLKELAGLGHVRPRSGPPWCVELNYLGKTIFMAGVRTYQLDDGQQLRIYRKRASGGISVWLDQPGEKPLVKPLRQISPNIFIGPLEDRGVLDVFFVPAVWVSVQR